MPRTPLNITIQNCTITHYYNSATGEFLAYNITPNTGYCLHDKGLDIEVLDEETFEPTGEILLGYCTASAGCGYNYEFTEAIVDGYTAYGNREFFARPISEVSSDQIFGNVEPPHETI